jgi:phosphopantetheinyl transferase (holo-ACP synthase)
MIETGIDIVEVPRIPARGALPESRVHGKRDLLKLGVRRGSLSLSHTAEQALAQVMLEDCPLT